MDDLVATIESRLWSKWYETLLSSFCSRYQHMDKNRCWQLLLLFFLLRSDTQICGRYFQCPYQMMVVARSTIVENLVWEIDYFSLVLAKKILSRKC